VDVNWNELAEDKATMMHVSFVDVNWNDLAEDKATMMHVSFP
jgi:hypothetical protein